MIGCTRILLLMVMLHSLEANLFNNSKMEEAFSNNNWYCQGCDVERSTDKFEGTYSANVTGRNQKRHGLTQSVSLTGNTRYKALVMVKLSNLNSATDLFNTVELLYECEDDNGNKDVIKFGKVKFTHENRWTKIGGVIKTVAVVKNCLVYVQVDGPNVNYLVDDSELVIIPDDPNWKTTANQRIKEQRKIDIIITPSNVGSNTYEIELTQTKHLFPFGINVKAEHILDSNTDYKHYQDKVYELFNWAVIANKLKCKHMEGTQGVIDYEDAIKALKNMTARGCIGTELRPLRYTQALAHVGPGLPKAEPSVKGTSHCTFWSTDDKVQDWMKALNTSELTKAMTARINDVIPRTKGLRGLLARHILSDGNANRLVMCVMVHPLGTVVKHWDVNNENIHGDFFEQRLGNKDITSQLFRDVRALDSKVQLFLNDYNIIHKWDAAALLDQALRLKADNVPIYGLGIQSHVVVADIDIVTMKERLDIINEAKLPLWITELTIEESNATLKASAFVDLMTLYFSYPRVKGILIGGSWGGVVRDIGKVLWEGGNATTPMVPNAAGVAVENLLKNTWMTKETLNATTNDQQTVNAFQGNYQLKVKQDGAVKVTKYFRLGKQNRNVAIDFSATPIAITVK